MNDFSNMWDFDVLEGVDFQNCNRVHPLMQKRVQYLLGIMKEDPNIERIVLFGSSLEFRCSSYSDIDLYIKKRDKEIPLKTEPMLDCEVDIVCNLEPGSALYKEIDKKGLLLYERRTECVM